MVGTSRLNTLTTDTTNDDLASMLRESARDFTSREMDLRAFRARMQQPPGHDKALSEQMQQLGWTGALVPEDLGGSGMGLREVAAIAEELGRGLLGDVFLSTSVLPVALLQDRAAAPAARALLQGVADGSHTLALAWQERPEALTPDAVETQARAHQGNHILNGAKHWVAGGSAATVFLVTARLDGGLGVFKVPRDAPGLSLETHGQVDGSASLTLQLREVQVDADAMVIGPAEGVRAVTRALDASAIAASAELLGVTSAAFDMTMAYMKTRVQYDKIIGSFQALQHKAVDLLVQRELAASVLEEATAALDGGNLSDTELSQLASRCKARCSDAALRITRECIQLHGAIGYTHEYDLGLYVKRALVLSAWLGNAGQHRQRHASLL